MEAAIPQYYQTNDVYERLGRRAEHKFIWVVGNAWILIYGDGSSNPKVCALVWGKSATVKKNTVRTVRWLAKNADLPFFMIHFDDTIDEINSVKLSINGSSFEEIGLEELRSQFSRFGLPISNRGTTKLINDKSSSAYHKWQRSNLGRITVSDIDLIRLSKDKIPLEIIELKRSFYSLDKWTPFSDDFPNFNLLESLADACSIEMTIAYNVRHKNPFRDDAANLSIFEYAANRASKKGTVSFEDFVKGTYV